MKRHVIATTGAALLLILLTGCTPSGQAVEDFSGVPDDITTSEKIPVDTDGAPQAFYLNDGGELAVVLWGSSTCPYIGTDISVVKEADEGNEVEVAVAPLPDQPCTMDLVPHTTVFWTPTKTTTTKPLIVRVLDAVIEVPVK
ncbi:hypothetical protein ASF62_04700 [Leifsonia sp. Leaf325]|nr:hypothetical protein [Leifsonia sp. Leaf325]KQQ95787.1 hypothetical protein ASF62_04700 [Leifsonia sp. Leaf325]